MNSRDTDAATRDDRPHAAAAAMVGRHRELAEAQAAIETGLAGSGGLLLINGEAGIGKTRLIEELATRAPPGVRVLWGACWPDPGTPSFWPWRSVLRDCAAALELELGDDLAPILGIPGHTAGPAEQLRLRLFHGVERFLRQSASVQPLLIVLEDLHLADEATLALLRFVATTLRGQRVVIVGSHRYPDIGRDAPLAEELGGLGRTARTVSLFGLDTEHTSDLMRVATGQAPDSGLADRVHQRTRGNPLFVIEVARLLAAGAHLDARHIVIPPTVQQVIGQRLAHISSDGLDVLACASVAGQVFSATVLQEVSAADRGRLADLLDEAIMAGLVRPMSALGEFGFTHALVRDVLYAGMPATRRRTRHRQTAEAIERLHGPDLDPHLGELADHCILALPETDPARALDYSRRAGRQALQRLAYAEAERHLAGAVDLAQTTGLGEAERVELLLALGEARLRAGDWQNAIVTYEEAAASARRRHRPEELARAALGLGAGLSGFEVRLFDQRQLDLLREALDALGDEEPELRAWVLARLSVAESYLSAEEVRIAHSEEAVDLARQAGDPKLLTYALSSYCDAVSGPAHTEHRLVLADEMVQLGIDANDAESELLGRRFRAVALLESGDVTGVGAEAEAFERTAARLRWPLVEWYPMLWRGTRAVIEGRLGEAEQLTAAVRRIGDRGGSVNAGIVADVQHLQMLLEQGRPGEVHELMGRFIDDPEGGPNAEAWLALPLVRMGRHAEARAALDRLAAAGFPLVMDAAWLEVIAGVAEACAELPHREAASRLLPLLEPFADRFATGAFGGICLGSLSRHLGLLAHCVGRLDEADAYFRRASLKHRGAGATLLVAHTLRQHAALLTDRDGPGDRSEAGALLVEADQTYRELGLDHWAQQPVDTDSGTAASVNLFRREGDVWAVRYGGLEARVRHVKGLPVLARLLAEPGREFHVLDLAGEESGAALHAVEWRDTGEVIDAQAREAYRQRLADLESHIDAAAVGGDAVSAERAQRERDALVEQLTAAYGLGGRVRHGNDPVERARTTVTKQIRSAIARIAAAAPALAAHLTHSIRTGRYCSYAPEKTVVWEE